MKSITFKMPAEYCDKLDDMAKDQDRSRSIYLKRLVMEHVDNGDVLSDELPSNNTSTKGNATDNVTPTDQLDSHMMVDGSDDDDYDEDEEDHYDPELAALDI